jgi:3-phosphoshikimate 1-carboxyvinyltransferase
LNRARLIRPAAGLHGKLKVPSSKSYTHRALLLAALADGTSSVSNSLSSRDTDATLTACQAVGARVNRHGDILSIDGGRPKLPEDVVDASNSGTTLRFMTSVLAQTEKGHSIITGDSSLRRRPAQPLLDALGALGGLAFSTRNNGCAPIVVRGGGLDGGDVTIGGDVSSQFVSSLLISVPLSRDGTRVRVTEAASRPYIDATLHSMRAFGVDVAREGYELFDVRLTGGYRASTFEVPGDFSSASFLMAAVAMVGGDLEIAGLDTSVPQGDSAIMSILKKMGCDVGEAAGTLTVAARGDDLEGGRFDLHDTPDLLPVLAALSLRCSSPVEIVGVAHARFKETDRIAVLAGELTKLGVRLDERQDGLFITPPGELRPTLLDAHGDHRMFMAFALASMLAGDGCSVEGVDSLDVSYPGFLADLSSIGAGVRIE